MYREQQEPPDNYLTLTTTLPSASITDDPGRWNILNLNNMQLHYAQNII